jgi:hypothetical protein
MTPCCPRSFDKQRSPAIYLTSPKVYYVIELLLTDVDGE